MYCFTICGQICGLIYRGSNLRSTTLHSNTPTIRTPTWFSLYWKNSLHGRHRVPL